MTKPPISEFEAAAMTAMSPDLLRWFTKYAPKSGIKRKLRVADKKNDAYFFDAEEVVSFDQWLKLPWPKKDGKRPGIPKAIRDEIKVEAGGECAICNKHEDTCEAAHIDPVSQSFNNHPENLIWLCANHHTAYDKGLFGPAEAEEDFIVGFKLVLRRYRVMLWKMQHEASHVLFSVLDNCDHLQKQLAAATTKEQVAAVQSLAEKTLKKLPKLAAVSKADPNYANVKALSNGINALKVSKVSVPKRLVAAQSLRTEYAATFGFVACPLCKGTGHHDHGDCPVCHGDREIDERLAESVDLTDFEKINCPLCEGSGRHNGDECPACAGERNMDRRDASYIDLRDFDLVNCPVCEGKGEFRGVTCRECGGEGELERQHAARIDAADYKVVKCPLCKGRGQYDGRDCPECGGNGDLLAREAALVELDSYNKVRCPLCRGKGHHNFGDCPVCGGEGSIEKRHSDSVDLRAYELVNCPRCSGRGSQSEYDCAVCGGERKIERRHAEDYDPREFD
ncbi:hypothetical protein CO662_36175 [Rhizobium anhuiense]|uniref:HNH nuclease domain-containing protein n=1 Tax=Rhizobium anhuiense TaxID=1184720 RepID=A0ABX4IWE3_9HYPH|nr:HNH endonuclease signature motif containing protein [Rhizobium anhuiense]PDS46348.1 hypothetical protein CO662_36175 [Rhizobium anhuiense]